MEVKVEIRMEAKVEIRVEIRIEIMVWGVYFKMNHSKRWTFLL